jgi:hypothetical protein
MEKERGWSTGGISFIIIIIWREDGEGARVEPLWH